MTNIRKYLVSALCFLDRSDEAKHEHRELLNLEPDFRWMDYLARYPFGRGQDRADLETALYRAGLIERGLAPKRAQREAGHRPSVVTLHPSLHSKRT